MKFYRIKQIYRLASQLISKNQVAVIGGYHGVNLGDMALGHSVLEILDSKNIKGCLQTIYTLDKYPWSTTQYGIIGGGAVGYKESLLKVVNRFKGNFKNVALLGVDYNDSHYDESIVSLIKDSAWVSCRNMNQSSFVENLINKENVLSHPDLVFSYKKDLCKSLRASRKKKTLLVNVVPLYSKIENNRLVLNESYKHERPELYENYNVMIQKYTELVRKIITDALAEGYRVESIPFTPDDEIIGKIIMKGLKVTHNNYSDDPIKMLRKIGSAEKVFATRYHALIFGLKVGAKILPMAYAKKNEFLLTELGVNRDEFTTSDDLANGEVIIKEYIKVKEDVVEAWENNCSNVLNDSINALLTK